MSSDFEEFEEIDEEQLPVAKNKLHNWTHFAGLYAAEHVAATEFVIGATFVALGAKTMDIVLGLLIGNVLAVLSWTFITSPIAVDTRLSLYTYLNKIAGDSMTKLYNWANVIIFSVISAAMITVSATAVRFAFDIPAQLNWYPTNPWFVLIVFAVGIVVVSIALYGFNAVSEFSSICAPWLFVMFTSGAMVLLPALSLDVLGKTLPAGWDDFISLGNQSIWTGFDSNGEPGIGLVEVIGFAWAANTITHFGLIDMALLRFAKKKSYGLATSTGMMFGHYVAWIAAGIMGAGAAVILGKSIVELDPGDVAYYALGWSGFVIVIVAGWTTAITNLYRAGLAAQAIFYNHSRKKTTIVVGLVTIVIACFPFVFSQILPLLTYAGLLVVPVGAIVFAEHQIFPRIGYTRYWLSYRQLAFSTPAVASWGLGLVFGFGLNALDVMSFFYLFVPTWVFTILVYTLLAARYGAKQKYPEAELKEKLRNENIKKFQEQKGKFEVPHSTDNSTFSSVLRVTGIVALLITLVLACIVLFGSSDESLYLANREVFYRYAFICTVLYFVVAYWALLRGKQKNKIEMKNIIALNQNNLTNIAKQIPCPTYPRNELTVGMVHVGVGGFHRAHQAYYTNMLLEKFNVRDWAICGIGLRKGDQKIHNVLNEQEGLYTLIVKHPDGKIEPQIMGAIIDFRLGVDSPKPVIQRMAHPDTKIVSLTITEGGYNFNPSTGDFDFENQDIQHELKNPDSPKTIYGFLTAALKKRRDSGLPAFTIMSCDNIQHNGDVARNMLLSFAKRQDEELANWIEKEVCFPNSMVDRITPVTTQSDIDYLEKTFGLQDEWPVTCEPFIQWVVEDNFSNGRPEFEKVGVQFVSDVKPYEKMKLRLLNAGHSVLGILGAIHGHPTINACMEDETFVTYLRAFMDEEATPTLDKLEGIDLNVYKDSLLERFANPNIKDSVSRICSESSAKLPKFLIATLQENLDSGGSIQFATLVIAAWCYYSDKGMDKNGQPIEIIDAMAAELQQAARQTKTDTLAFIKQKSLFGDLGQNERFTKLYTEFVQQIYKDGSIKNQMQTMI